MKNAPSKPRTALRVGLISLGCAKNLVDSEIILGSLLAQGLEVTNETAQADAVIVNSCGFIGEAQAESVDAILESDAARHASNPNQALIVAGCLPQRFREELPTLLPEVDAFIGVDQVAQVHAFVQEAVVRRKAKVAAGSGATAVPSRSRRARKTNFPAVPSSAPAPAKAPLAEITPRPTYIPDFATPRFRLTPRHYAYLKIAEGCNHPCSFCTIPRMRGAHRSRAPQDILREARRLLDEGVKELNLISQDSTYYGLDLRPARTGPIASPEKFQAAAAALPAGAPDLAGLLGGLNGLSGQFWIRLLYTHPAHWTRDLMGVIARSPKVARYIDLPLQHIHDDLLERMRRETSRQYITDLIQELRARVPGIVLRTTFIVGFPGETEEHFQTLLRFIREMKFERLGVFAYSPESGTRAAKMQNHVPAKVKEQRRRAAMAEQQKVARSVAAGFLGKNLTVLVEQPGRGLPASGASIISWEHGHTRQEGPPERLFSDEYYIARGPGDAPDIDGRVYVRGKVAPGEFASVKVIGHTDYDLIAEAT